MTFRIPPQILSWGAQWIWQLIHNFAQACIPCVLFVLSDITHLSLFCVGLPPHSVTVNVTGGAKLERKKKKEEERSNRDQSHNPASVILINIYLILNMKDVRIYIQNSIHTQSFLFCLMSPHPCHLSPFHHYNILALSSPGFGLTSDPAAGSLEFCT